MKNHYILFRLPVILWKKYKIFEDQNPASISTVTGTCTAFTIPVIVSIISDNCEESESEL